MNVIRLGNPAIQVKITETGTCVAKLEYVRQVTRHYAGQNDYNVIETC
jgi:hypothetical protein